MNDTTVSEVVEKRGKLEKDILNLIEKFQNETGVSVDRINLSTTNMSDGESRIALYHSVNVSIRI